MNKITDDAVAQEQAAKRQRADELTAERANAKHRQEHTQPTQQATKSAKRVREAQKEKKMYCALSDGRTPSTWH
jgi:hypothetical protein